RFRSEHDSSHVRSLLLERLARQLPGRREYTGISGEWTTHAWTAEELEGALETGMDVPALQTGGLGLRPFDTDVPDRLALASSRGFAIKRMSIEEALSPMRPLTSFRFDRGRRGTAGAS